MCAQGLTSRMISHITKQGGADDEAGEGAQAADDGHGQDQPRPDGQKVLRAESARWPRSASHPRVMLEKGVVREQ